MNRKFATYTLLLGALAMPLASFAGDTDSDRSSPKAFIKDSAITAEIKAKMAADDQVSALHIKVDTDNNGVVTLTGKAKSRAEAAKAATIARKVEGVKAVNDHIMVAADR